MTLTLLAIYCALAVSLMRSVLVTLHILPPLCSGCGLPRERRHLGERICACAATH
ncbi:MAG TPA: hypothetical protein VK874_06420 [Gaiellaceae bacterium]|jgi:hypothetical protein|nr:hypothetical protein [Gaiellaceae bacterium]